MAEQESLKIHEAHEHAELAHIVKSLAPVSTTMAILAVLTVAVSLLGHRSHNEVVLSQVQANFQKAELVGKRTQQHADEVLIQMLGVMNTQSTTEADALKEKFREESKRFANDLEQTQTEEQRLVSESQRARRAAYRLDIGELFCEMAIVLCSITLLTRQRKYWCAGMASAGLGLFIAVSAFLQG